VPANVRVRTGLPTVVVGATTPGGINSVPATAAADHADMSLIASVQSLRLFSMVLLAPLIIRVMARWLDRPSARRHR
jgi:uncharacterized membrane protein AbrB (regulator of aidB expression)